MTHALNLFNASAACKAFIDARALEELFGKRNYGRIEAGFESKKSGFRGGSHYSAPIDLRRPAPFPTRPVSSSGRTTTHIEIKVVSKTASPAGSHQATTVNPATSYSKYVSAEGKVAHFERELGHRYLVAPKTDGERGSDETRAAILVTNINSDPKKVDEYWTQRWQAARDRGEYRLELTPDRGSAADWKAVADDADTPARIATIARRISILLAASRRVRRSVVLIKDDAVMAWASALKQQFGRRKNDRMIHFVKPRSAKVQLQVIFEFDERLDGADRYAVLNQLCAAFDKAGIRVLAVAHDPDPNNDPRNFHPHVLIDPTKFPRLEDGELSSSEGRKLRPGELAELLGYLPLYQNALGFDRLSSLDYHAVRKKVTRLGNERLEAKGLKPQFYAGSFAELGIKKKPEKHLGSAAAARVAAGGNDEVDFENALKSCRFEMSRLDAGIEGERAALEQFGTDARQELTSVGDPDNLEDLELLERHRELAASIIARARELADFDISRAIASSNAERLKRKTDRVLRSLEPGQKATAADRQNEARIRGRNRLAIMHLDELNDALLPYQTAVEAARERQARDRAELEQVAHMIQSAIEERRMRAASAEWARATILDPDRYPQPLSPLQHFDALFAHLMQQGQKGSAITSERAIHVFRAAHSGPLNCQGLRSADLHVVRERGPFYERWQAALLQAEKTQNLTISKLLELVKANGSNALADGFGHGGKSLTPSLSHNRDLMQTHPLFIAGRLRAEDAYRRSVNNDHYLRLDDKASPPEAALPITLRNSAGPDVGIVSVVAPLSHAQSSAATTQEGEVNRRPTLGELALPDEAAVAAPADGTGAATHSIPDKSKLVTFEVIDGVAEGERLARPLSPAGAAGAGDATAMPNNMSAVPPAPVQHTASAAATLAIAEDQLVSTKGGLAEPVTTSTTSREDTVDPQPLKPMIGASATSVKLSASEPVSGNENSPLRGEGVLSQTGTSEHEPVASASVVPTQSGGEQSKARDLPLRAGSGGIPPQLEPPASQALPSQKLVQDDLTKAPDDKPPLERVQALPGQDVAAPGLIGTGLAAQKPGVPMPPAANAAGRIRAAHPTGDIAVQMAEKLDKRRRDAVRRTTQTIVNTATPAEKRIDPVATPAARAELMIKAPVSRAEQIDEACRRQEGDRLRVGLTSTERLRFEADAKAIMRRVRNKQVTLKVENEEVRICTSSDDILRQFRLFCETDLGWSLLAAIAETLADPLLAEAGVGWARIDRPTEGAPLQRAGRSNERT